MQLTSKSDVILQRTRQREKQGECPHGTTEEHREPQQA